MVPCDPSTLAQLATCFSCVPVGAVQSLNSYLYCTIEATITGKQPVFINSQVNGVKSSSNTITIPAFNATGGNYLLVAVTWRNPPALRSITSFTANGVAMGQIDTVFSGDLNSRVALYGLLNPTSGNIVINWDGNIVNGIAAAASLFNGVVS